jgi:hypothetical protein
LFANKHSAKDDLFIVPPHMNDFGIYSKRATLSDWAEGANALYLDKQFTEEWVARMDALGWRTWNLMEKGYSALSTEQIVAAAQKYGAKFIITQKPKKFALNMLYENEGFALYALP